MPELITQLDYTKPIFNTVCAALSGFPTTWEYEDMVYSLTDINGSYDLTLHDDELFGQGMVFGAVTSSLSVTFEARDKSTNTLQYGYMGHLNIHLLASAFQITLYSDNATTRYRRGLYPNHRTFDCGVFFVATKIWDGDSWEDYYPPDGFPITIHAPDFTGRLWTPDANGTPVQRRVALIGGPILAGQYPMLGTAWLNLYSDLLWTGRTPSAGSAVTLTIAT